ncbi:MAG: hypothetical protein D6725_06500 [Planctomycetota bacterium]|nr:MAG: hypothetical protein D6725_06500 [Planctomycetota bacterium]
MLRRTRRFLHRSHVPTGAGRLSAGEAAVSGRRSRLLLGALAALCSLGVLSGATLGDEAEAPKTRKVKVKDIELVIPQSWKQRPPSNRLRLAQFDIPPAEGDKGKVELVVSSFGGSGGGVDPNIRRWIAQFQAPGRKVKLATGESPQGKYVIADITGTYNQPVGPPILRQTRPLPNARMIAVILMPPNKPYYFLKMAGPARTVGAAVDDLRRAFGGDAAKEKPYELAN